MPYYTERSRLPFTLILTADGTTPLTMRSGILLSATALSVLVLSTPVLSFTSYANDFIDPNTILSKDFSNVTAEAQETIMLWADQLAAKGPWCESPCFDSSEAYGL